MKAIQPYLFFNGNCREAMEFYASALGGKLNVMTYAQAPNAPADGADRVMHANILASDGSALMASDAMPEHPVTAGLIGYHRAHTSPEIADAFASVFARRFVAVDLCAFRAAEGSCAADGAEPAARDASRCGAVHQGARRVVHPAP